MPVDHKSAGITDVMDKMAKAAGGPGLDAPANQCVMCGASIVAEVDPNKEGAFKDALSLREFGISRTCQGCQDTMFAPPWEETTLGEIVEAFEAGFCLVRRNPVGFVLNSFDGDELGQADSFEDALVLIAKATRKALDG